MMKPGVSVFVVESVEKAVKFYTEKLAFDVAGLSVDKETRHSLNYVLLRKGKCFLAFRTPSIDELAEFSLVKRCSNRGAGVYVPMKKGLDKYFERCKKKKIQAMSSSIETMPWGDRTFYVKDSFGMRIVFAESIEGFKPEKPHDFCGLNVQEATEKNLEEMVKYLKGFGVLRRAAKKYAKAWMKEVFGKKF